MRTTSLLVTLMCVLPAVGQVCLTDVSTLTLPPEPARIGLGWSTAGSSEFLVAGLPFDETDCRDGNQPCDPNGNTGGLAIWQRSGSDWTLQSVVGGFFPAPGDLFGSSTLISDTQLLVGAAGRGAAGLVSQYGRVDNTWTLQGVVAGSDLSPDAGFGWSMAWHDDLLVVGAPFHQGRARESGAAHVFERNDQGRWDEVARLEPNDLSVEYLFGLDVATDGETVAIGAPGRGETSHRGAVYLFNRNDGFAQTARLEGNNRAIQFGHSVAVRGGTIVIGSPRQSFGSAFEQQFLGGAYIFQQQEGSWMPVQRLRDREGVRGDYFGSDVVLGEGWLAAGALFDTPETGGAGALVFVQRNGRWTAAARLRDAAGQGVVARSMAVLPDGLVLGNGGAVGPGTVTFVGLRDCTPVGDVDANCVVNLADLAVVLAHFGQQEAELLSGDVNADEVVDATDLQLLLETFGRACD